MVIESITELSGGLKMDMEKVRQLDLEKRLSAIKIKHMEFYKFYKDLQHTVNNLTGSCVFMREYRARHTIRGVFKTDHFIMELSGCVGGIRFIHP